MDKHDSKWHLYDTPWWALLFVAVLAFTANFFFVGGSSFLSTILQIIYTISFISGALLGIKALVDYVKEE